jgi:hypothetical protein
MGLPTAEVIQTKIFPLPCDYRCKREVFHELVVPTDAKHGINTINENHSLVPSAAPSAQKQEAGPNDLDLCLQHAIP